jgi:2-oxoglutarate ferredoxin oxidoreductase subunit delta
LPARATDSNRLIYNDAVTTKNLITKKLPVFMLTRCKRCGICSHFCAAKAIATRDDGAPFLADPEACTSCKLCEDMCPDWAVCLSLPDTGEPDTGTA